MDGADYESTYGITTSGDALTLTFVTGENVGSRVYLMAEDDESYQTFDLVGNEFTFDVDVSNLPCGLNGALYFTSMDADGGVSKYPANKAGAKVSIAIQSGPADNTEYADKIFSTARVTVTRSAHAT